VVSFKDLRNYLAVFFLISSASASLAAENVFDLESAALYQTVSQTDESPTFISGGANSICLPAYATSFGNAVANQERRNRDGLVNECVEDTATLPIHISLHEDNGKVIWSLAPLLSRFSFNPIDDIRNLQVVLKYRF
jgi:hypothetical protein